MQVAQLWRFPVKSLQGEQVDAAELGPQGITGDRQWAIFDVQTGFGLTARRMPQLLFASARLRGGDVEISLPDGTTAGDDEALSAWLGRPVELRNATDPGTRQYENPQDIETEAPESWAPFEGSAAAFHDGFSVTLLSTATIEDRALRRFRANVVLDRAGEDGLVGAEVQVGDAVVGPVDAVARCVMVTRAQPDGIEIDRDVLRWIHRERGGLLAVGGTVLQPGSVRVGDPVTLRS